MRIARLLAAALLLLAPSQARAAILFSSPTANTAAPTGSLTNAGWQYEGDWNGFLGTAIAPHYFITAAHVGGSNGGTFTYEGQNYTADSSSAYVVNGQQVADLRIWHVTGTFATFAPLYTDSDELGKNLFLVGKGLSRGSAINVNGHLAGWQFTGTGQAKNWGENVVSSIYNGDSTIPSGQAKYGDYLEFDFDQNGRPNEATLAFGDSGGGVFVQGKDGIWKLAGVNEAIDGAFNTANDSSAGFYGAIFDARGLYVGSANNWIQVDPNFADPIPAGAYATRISTNADWIEATAAGTVVPEPTSLGLAVMGAIPLIARPRKKRPAGD